VALLEVVLDALRAPPGRLDARLPALGVLADRRWIGRAAPAGDRHVAAVADDVDEAGLGQGLRDAQQALAVTGRLVAPARLAETLGVGLVESAQSRAGIERLALAQALAQPAGVQAE